MEPDPALDPHIAALAIGLRQELLASSSVDVVLVDEAIGSMIRLELHLLLPAARDPNDEKWDRAHDRLFRRFLRAVDTVRYPKQRRPAQPQRPREMTPAPGGMAAALGGHAAQHQTSAEAQRPGAMAAASGGHTAQPQASATTPARKTKSTAPIDHTTPEQPSRPQPSASPTDHPTAETTHPATSTPDSPKRRPDPAKALRQSRQERRRLARQHATPRASPA